MKECFIMQALMQLNTRLDPSSTKNTLQKSNFWLHFKSKHKRTKLSKKQKTKAQEAYFRLFTTILLTLISRRTKINVSKNRYPVDSTIANALSQYLTLSILSGTLM